MNKLNLKPGVLTGSAVTELFAYCKEIGCALPAVGWVDRETERPKNMSCRRTCRLV